MEYNSITNLAQFDLQQSQAGDANAPFSFIEWKKRIPLIEEKDAHFHYNKYVIDWFNTKKINSKDVKTFFLKQRYLYLLEQLQLFFDTKEKNEWYSYINLANEKELLIAIPYFARKLKNITLYYLKLRNQLKNVKLKYNLVGSKFGIEKELTHLFLETFSDKNEEPNPDITIPKFDDIAKNLNIEIEELYDDHQYFDISFTQPITAYHDILNEATANFYSTKGLTLSSEQWVFDCFNLPVSSSYTTFIETVTSALLEPTDEMWYLEYVNRYIGERKFLVEFLPENNTSTAAETFEIPIKQGNNFFYYPYGSVDFSLKQPKQMKIVALSSIEVVTSQGTAGTDLTNSDTMFVKVGSEMKGAWLRYVEYDELSRTMKANIQKDSTNSFIYPFPGFGLSSVDIPWTGPSLESDIEYNFLTKEMKGAVNESYWSYTFPSDQATTFQINDTTLAQDGATAHLRHDKADHIYVRTERNVDTTNPRSEVAGAWLYKFVRTALPISPFRENKIIWPLQSFESDDVPTFTYTANLSGMCVPVSLDSLTRKHFIAGNSFDTADRIYRISHPDDTIENATEVAWLSGRTYTNVFDTDEARELYGDNTVYIDLSTSHISQEGFNALFTPGKPTRFIWGGQRATLNSVFGHTPHAKDCPHNTNVPPVSSSYDWDACACKAVFHSPIGHNYPSLESGNYAADVIIECTKSELEEFNFGSWLDRFGKGKNESKKFAWFRTRKNKGVFPGRWVSDITTSEGGVLQYAPFDLIPGKMYIYRRASLGERTPKYSKTYPYLGGATSWMSAVFTPRDGWIGTTTPSKMKLSPGTFLRYERKSETTNYLISAVETDVENQNRGSVWASYDFLPLRCIGGDNNSTIITWPFNPKPLDFDLNYSRTQQASAIDVNGDYTENKNGWSVNDVNNQWPSEPVQKVKITKWVVSRMPDAVSNFETLVEEFYSSSGFTFTPSLTGFYKVQVFYSVDTNQTELDPNSTIDIPSSDTGGVLQEVELNSIKNYGYDSSYPLEVDIHLETKTSDSFTKPFINRNTNARTELTAQLTYTTIPMITVVPPTEIVPTPIEVTHPSNAFLLEHKLKGWNYNKNISQTYEEGNYGAKPYWATIYTAKDANTKYKGLNTWGYKLEYIDEYLPDPTPRYSTLNISYGNTVEYHRRGSSFVWEQPIVYKQFLGKAQWCRIYNKLDYPSTLANDYKITEFSSALAVPLTSASDINLSNIINGSPVEVYYNAISDFTWTVSAQLSAPTLLPTPQLWYSNLDSLQSPTNSFYPTIATVPVLENVYSIKDVGGYFLPQNLGASYFFNKNYTVDFKTKNLSGSFLTEDITQRVGGRGRTKEDQPSLFTWTEDNEWMKEPITMGNLTGAVKKSLTKPLQTFVPYFSNDNSNELGLLSKKTKVSPWGGINDEEWVDTENEPRSFTGRRSLEQWKSTQIAYNKKDFAVENLCSDIFGNQYGIFKNPSTKTYNSYKTSNGALWIKDIDQNVKDAVTAIPSIFEYFDIKTNEFNSVECFHNLLFLKNITNFYILGITQDYDTNNIVITTDNAKTFKEADQLFQQNIHIPEQKSIYSLFLDQTKNKLPIIYRSSFTTNDLQVFPVLTFDLLDVAELSNKVLFEIGVPIASVTFTKGVMSFNSDYKTFLITLSGTYTDPKTQVKKMLFLDFYAKGNETLVLTKINLYA